MKAINLTLSFLLALGFNTALISQGPSPDCDDLVVNCITYIEEEDVFDLGFETEDYLPLDFDPHRTYVNLDDIQFIDDEEMTPDFSAYLPAEFNAYAFPRYFRSIDYVDPSDEFTLDFDTMEYLPEGFDPYESVSESNAISL